MRILLVFQTNFIKNDQGNSSYVYNIVKYLKSRNHHIDYFTIPIFSDFSDFEEINKQEQLVDNFYLCGHEYNIKKYLGWGVSKKYKNDGRIKYYLLGLHFFTKRQTLTWNDLSWLDDFVLEQFQAIVNTNNYDFIYINQIHFADLLKYAQIPSSVKKVYSMHDAFFMQLCHYHGIERAKSAISDEIDKVGLFDEIISLSADEKYFFEKFYPQKKFYHLPHLISKIKLPKVTKTINVLFVGFANPHNKAAIQWFIDKVVPHLRNKQNITICGRVWNLLEDYVQKAIDIGIQRIDYSPNLDDLFAATKVSIVPMFSGAGMKIKTSDAMARSIPVVATPLGVDGFADKNENGCLVTDDPETFAFYIDKLLDDEDFYKQCVQKQDCYFAKYLSLEANAKILDEVFG